MLVFEALADETRVRIIEALAERDHSVNELVELFPISQPAVSRHLRVLRDAGLVSVTSDAQRRVYRLEPDGLLECEEWARRCRSMWQRQFERLGNHLDEMATKETRRER